MGACMSSGGIDVSEEDKRLHREAEKSLKEVRRRPVCTQETHFDGIVGQSENVSSGQGISQLGRASSASETESHVLGFTSRIRRLWQVDHPKADAAYPQRAILIARSRVLPTARIYQYYSRSEIPSRRHGRHGSRGPGGECTLRQAR